MHFAKQDGNQIYFPKSVSSYEKKYTRHGTGSASVRVGKKNPADLRSRTDASAVRTSLLLLSPFLPLSVDFFYFLCMLLV